MGEKKALRTNRMDLVIFDLCRFLSLEPPGKGGGSDHVVCPRPRNSRAESDSLRTRWARNNSGFRFLHKRENYNIARQSTLVFERKRCRDRGMRKFFMRTKWRFAKRNCFASTPIPRIHTILFIDVLKDIKSFIANILSNL